MKVDSTVVTIYAKWVEAEEETVESSVADPSVTGVAGWLETIEHVKYLNGYDNGSFGPDNNMTRAEVAQMFYNLLLNKDVAIQVQFSDVAGSAWYATAVNTLASLGIVKGTGDDTFSPERPISRAEFTVIAMRFAKLDNSGTNPFSDVSSGDWFYDSVVGAVKYGWINGYADGTFHPNNTITRAEVTAIVNRMLDRSADQDYVDSYPSRVSSFNDLSNSYWAYYEIMEATNAHEYSLDKGVERWDSVH